VRALRERYTGDVARAYERRRLGTQWDTEHAVLSDVLTRHSPESVLDVPCGTGRFWPIYRDMGIPATGRDLSEDMLEQARSRGWKNVGVGDIFALSGQHDCAVCFRLLNWMERRDCVDALGQLREVARWAVVSIGLGAGNAGRTLLHDPGVFSESGWRVTEDVGGGGHANYRIVVLR
jgi:ubiquinone/menaquinone biosynthesis C-methylase UbiE